MKTRSFRIDKRRRSYLRLIGEIKHALAQALAEQHAERGLTMAEALRRHMAEWSTCGFDDMYKDYPGWSALGRCPTRSGSWREAKTILRVERCRAKAAHGNTAPGTLHAL
jgi:hypothetical protein